MPDEIKRMVNGLPLAVEPGTSIAAALTRAGQPCRTSVSGEPRGPLCGMGICFECRADVNGQLHSRTCQMESDQWSTGRSRPLGTSDQWSAGRPRPAEPSRWSDNSHVPKTKAVPHNFDVLVIGGGPAGIAAACRAAESGQCVGVVDDNPALGGQIWRGESQNTSDSDCHKWLARIQSTGVVLLSGLRVFEQPEPGLLLAEGADDICELRYAKLVLATGARERFLPFPGWTLMNVMGAGGLQAMVKRGLPIAGKRVLVAGTGPLLLAVAGYLRKKGALIPFICEQASLGALAKFGFALVRQPAKLVLGLQLKRDLSGTKFVSNSWVVVAEGRAVLERVMISRNGRQETIPCDYLACGFHLVPNAELPLLLGCQLQNGFVAVDDFQKTTAADVYCAGEPTGIGGVELSLIEGEIAGLAAASRSEHAEKLFRKRARLRQFARTLDHAFCLRPELRALASPDTIVCRCEDITHSRLSRMTSWRAAKLHTRCGMGACQGRICGPATQFLFNWNPDSVRPPVFPVRLASMMAFPQQAETQQPELIGGLR